MQIKEYEKEIDRILTEQVGRGGDPLKRLNVFKLDMFSRKIVQDKYSLEKLRDFIYFLENCHREEKRQIQTKELIEEFENRIRQYFYSDNANIEVLSVLEGGGRNQIRTYGQYLLQKPFHTLNEKVVEACRLILDIIPSNYERTLKIIFIKISGSICFLKNTRLILRK